MPFGKLAFSSHRDKRLEITEIYLLKFCPTSMVCYLVTNQIFIFPNTIPIINKNTLPQQPFANESFQNKNGDAIASESQIFRPYLYIRNLSMLQFCVAIFLSWSLMIIEQFSWNVNNPRGTSRHVFNNCGNQHSMSFA